MGIVGNKASKEEDVAAAAVSYVVLLNVCVEKLCNVCLVKKCITLHSSLQ